MTRPVTGAAVARIASCLPLLSSDTRGFDAVPLVTATVPDSIFGSDLISEKSLDEVILAYLAEDMKDV